MNVTVVIPVYNAFAEAIDCLQSVCVFTPEDVPIVVIDDCSSDGEFKNVLLWHLAKRIRIERNEVNQGFPRTCNRAFFEFAPDTDIILLNSDTLVTERWVEKLQCAAYSRPDVGTVTPLTNNGTICSVPQFLSDNSIPEGFTLHSFSAIVEKCSRRDYPVLPTCVGHCLYLRRKPLDLARGFDAFTFGSGYGEENDFSCRIQHLGFVDILDDATYIYHKGKSSFGAASSVLQQTNAQLLDEKHPAYLPRVHSFIAHNPLHDIHARIWNALTCSWSQSREGTVLHILHNGPTKPIHHALGGTELHVADMIKSHPRLAHWSLVPKSDRYLLTAHIPGAERVIQLPRPGTPLEDIVHTNYFDCVHVHHALGFDREDLISAVRAHGRYFVSVHDYHLVCQHGMMLRPDGSPCNRHECVVTCKYTKTRTELERKLARAVLEEAEQAIVFSESSQEILANVFGDVPRVSVVPHGIAAPTSIAPRMFGAAEEISRPSGDAALRLICLGSVSTHKGLQVLERLSKVSVVAGIRLELHILGDVVEGSLDAIVHGPYQRRDVTDKLRSIDPHIGLVLSAAPETYCLTLDELLSAGIPSIVSSGGAPADRISRSGAGWVLMERAPAKLYDELLLVLEEILSDWSLYMFARRAASRTELRTLSSEMADYEDRYGRFGRVTKQGTNLLLQHFQPGLVPF